MRAKKLGSMVLAAMLALSMAGCGGDHGGPGCYDGCRCKHGDNGCGGNRRGGNHGGRHFGGDFQPGRRPDLYDCAGSWHGGGTER